MQLMGIFLERCAIFVVYKKMRGNNRYLSLKYIFPIQKEKLRRKKILAGTYYFLWLVTLDKLY